MKKTIRNLFTVICLLVILFTLTSCAFMGETPELDLEEAKENLEDNDYYVHLITTEEYEYAFTGDSANIEQMLEAYSNDDDEDDVLVITEFKDSKSALLALRLYKIERDSEIKTLKAEIKSIEHLLEEYEDDMDDNYVEKLEDDIKELKKELRKLQDDYVYGIDGNYVWYGTIDAVEDTK